MLHAGTLARAAHLLLARRRALARRILRFDSRPVASASDHDRRLAWLLLISTIPARAAGRRIRRASSTPTSGITLLWIPVFLVDRRGPPLRRRALCEARARDLADLRWLDALADRHRPGVRPVPGHLALGHHDRRRPVPGHEARGRGSLRVPDGHPGHRRRRSSGSCATSRSGR